MTVTPRTQFAATTTALLDEDPRAALVWAEISGRFLGRAVARHPDRVVNVGIREQLLVSVGAGMALTGLRPIVHTFSSFLVERAFEQVKLDFGHQGVGGVLVGLGGSFDAASAGRTHQSPGDMALLDTLPAISLHAPGTAAEVDAAIRSAVAGDGLHYVRVVEQVNSDTFPHAPGRLHVVRRGRGAVVVALGPVLDAVLEATAGRDVTVAYSATVRPFDETGLRELVGAGSGEVVLVEPWLAGTSARHVSRGLQDLPHRLLSLGVPRVEYRHYGTPTEHLRGHGLDGAGIAVALDRFVAAR